MSKLVILGYVLGDDIREESDYKENHREDLISFIENQKEPKLIFSLRKLLGFRVLELPAYQEYTVSLSEIDTETLKINGMQVIDKNYEYYAYIESVKGGISSIKNKVNGIFRLIKLGNIISTVKDENIDLALDKNGKLLYSFHFNVFDSSCSVYFNNKSDVRIAIKGNTDDSKIKCNYILGKIFYITLSKSHIVGYSNNYNNDYINFVGDRCGVVSSFYIPLVHNRKIDIDITELLSDVVTIANDYTKVHKSYFYKTTNDFIIPFDCEIVILDSDTLASNINIVFSKDIKMVVTSLSSYLLGCCNSWYFPKGTKANILWYSLERLFELRFGNNFRKDYKELTIMEWSKDLCLVDGINLKVYEY